jgi:hypothetical protein
MAAPKQPRMAAFVCYEMAPPKKGLMRICKKTKPTVSARWGQKKPERTKLAEVFW